MSASPINGATEAPIVSAAVAQAASAARGQGEPGRSSFGRVAEDPRTLQLFLHQNPEMAARLKAQVDIALKSPDAARNMRDKLGLGRAGMKNLCRACGAVDGGDSVGTPGRFPDPAEQQNTLTMAAPRGGARRSREIQNDS